MDIQTLCPEAGSRPQDIRQCLLVHRDQVSEQCRYSAEATRGVRASGEAGKGEKSGPANLTGVIEPTHANLAYTQAPSGTNQSLLSLDLYLPAAKGTPLVVFVHGGGWANGDKRGGEGGKPAAFVGQGYAYATVNYRLYPKANPDEQAGDIAKAIAYLQANATTYGYDSARVVLMGHSAGAHLAALTALNPAYLHKVGVNPKTVGTLILLDGAGYDIPRQVASGGNAELYRTVFGTDKAEQIWLSPLTYVGKGPTPHTLAHYVAERRASQLQAESLVSAIRATGSTAEIHAAAGESHSSINRGFGEPGDATTEKTFSFLSRVMAEPTRPRS